MAKAFGELRKGLTTNQIPIEKATYLKSHLQLSSKEWTDLRIALSDFTRLPTKDELREYVKKFLPQRIDKEHGVFFDLYEAVHLTLLRLPKSVKDKMAASLENGSTVLVRFAGGMDTSGGHRVYNSASSLAENVDTTHMFFGGVSLVHIKAHDGSRETLYKNKNAASVDAERPIMIFPGKETPAKSKVAHDWFTDGYNRLKANPPVLDLNGKKVRCLVEILFTQIDAKQRSIASGLGGAFCLNCYATQADAQDLDRIRQGFRIERDMDSVKKYWEKYKMLWHTGEFILPRGRKDRNGQTGEPLTNFDIVYDFSILHCRIRALYFFERLMYRLHCQIHNWSITAKKNPTGKKALDDAEDDFKLQVRKILKIKIDMPNPFGGTSDSGNTAERFFEATCRDELVDMVNTTPYLKECLKSIHKKFSIILRVLSSGRKIHTEEFNQYCYEAYEELMTSFPWARPSPTVHAFLAHGAERVQINDGYGLKTLSEQGLEGMHKLIRLYRENAARKTNLMDNLWDVIKTMWIRTDPEIQGYKRVILCSFCHQEGHTVKSCKELKKTGAALDDDRIVEQFFDGNDEDGSLKSTLENATLKYYKE